MKKLLLIAAVIAVLFAPLMGQAAELNNVRAQGVDGDLVFEDSSGNDILKLDESGRAVNIPIGSKITGLALKIATIAMTGVDYTLSAAEALCNILIVTGSPSGKSIVAPTVSTSGVSVLYTVRNAGADSASVVIKKSAGTGVTVATGKTAEVFWPGSDYARKTPDATN